MEFEAIGVVEAKYFTTALEIMDNMCKAADVKLLTSEKKLGGRLVTIIVGGSISNASAAIEAAKLTCEGKEDLLKMAIVISRPHEEIMKFIVSKEIEKERKEKSNKKKSNKNNENQDIKTVNLKEEN